MPLPALSPCSEADAAVEVFEALFVKKGVGTVGAAEAGPLVAVSEAHARGKGAARKARVGLQGHGVELGENGVLRVCGTRCGEEQQDAGKQSSHGCVCFVPAKITVPSDETMGFLGNCRE